MPEERGYTMEERLYRRCQLYAKGAWSYGGGAQLYGISILVTTTFAWQSMSATPNTDTLLGPFSLSPEMMIAD